MKNNVDLTTGRDFRYKTNHIFYQTTNRIPKLNNARFNLVEEYCYIGNDTGAILQGSAADRASKRMCDNFGRGEICDCCGTPIKPYYNDTLCLKCEERMKYNNVERNWR